MDKCPTHRVPGTSAAARANASADVQRGEKPTGQRPSTLGGAAPAVKTGPALDADGFQVVGGRRKPKGGTGGDADGDEGNLECDRRCSAEAAAGRTGDDSKGKGKGTVGGGHDDRPDVDDEEDHDQVEEEDEPSVLELRRRWQREIGVVKNLTKQLRADHPALRAAAEARDAAEAAWRSAKDPTPLALRLSRAQSKLDRAIEIQGETYAALCDLESDYEAKREALRTKLGEDKERVSERRRQLEEVQEEAGAQASGGVRRGGGDAIRQACGTLQGVTPVISALANELDASSPAWRALSGILESLQASQKLLQDAVTRPAGSATAQQFDIGDGAGGAPGGQGARMGGSECEWSESHDLPERGGQHGGDQGGQAMQDREADAGQESRPPPEADQDMGSGNWWETGDWRQHQQRRWQSHGHGKWCKTDWADAWEEERGGCGERDAQEPAAKHRRQDHGGGADAAGDADATAAAAAAAVAETARANAEAQRCHAERVATIVNQAIDAGVQPITHAGEDLHMLDANQLAAWVAEHLQHVVAPASQSGTQ